MSYAPPLVLVADDDPLLRSFVANHLGAMGCQVVEAANGKEALAHWETSSIDLVIVDVLMPEMDGLEVVLAIRKAGGNVPVLAISSGGRMDRSILLGPALAFGANETLRKPFTAEDLTRVACRLLNDRRQQPRSHD